MTQTKKYHREWRKKNPEKSRAIKQKYEDEVRKPKRRIIREQKLKEKEAMFF